MFSIGLAVNRIIGGVRPALKISNLPKLETGDLVEAFGLNAQYIGDRKILLCEPIFNSLFDKQSNDYDKSEVKKKLDEWFDDMLERKDND